ncbi:MAG TPA: 3'-5' exonuclease [Candidatus Dormibacteraeota bacterium]|nr:3'-5' exonuclease [Candidatus Dormibacteraeota bacterium]
MSIPDPAVNAVGPLGSHTEHPGDERPYRSGSRRRYGRPRGVPPAGDWFVSRLGPANGEPWAAIDDPPPAVRPGRPESGTPLDELRFVAVDCETTGQTPHRLVELGAVAFTLGGHVASFETLVHCTDRINPYARRLHGITSASLAGTPRPDAVLERFIDFAAGAVLVEHSADAFDSRLLARTTGRPFDADNVDTSRIAGLLWGLRDTIGLERLCSELGVVHRGPHTALGDAEATAACFLELLDRCRTLFGWTTLGQLLADAQPPPPRVVSMPVGSRPPRAVVPDGEGVEAAGEPEPRRRRRRGTRRRKRGAGTGGDDQAAPEAPDEIGVAPE